MSQSFNLIDQGWIPCMMEDGHSSELGLRELFAKADKIREIHGDSPLVTVSLHRLLLAILHRNFGPESARAWYKLRSIGAFDVDTLNSYLDKWHHRFDLFDRERPFYQDAALGKKLRQDEKLEKKWRNPISKMFHELASGNNPTLFDHTTSDANGGILFAAAARGLVTLQNYALSGIASGEASDGKSHPSHAPLVRGIVYLVRGSTLFETLMLNLIVYSPEDDVPMVCSSDGNVLAWEQESDKLWRSQQPRGYLDYLTWQSRRVWLFTSEAGDRVTGIAITEGNNFAVDSDLRDPHMAHIKANRAEKGTSPWPALKLRPERAVWRDVDALLQSVRAESERPKVIDHMATVMKGETAELVQFGLDAFGLANYQKAGKVNFWRHERLPLSADYLLDGVLVDTLRRCLSLTEETHNQLRDSLWHLASLVLLPDKRKEDLSKPDKDAIQSEQAQFDATSVYWGSLEIPFRELLERLPMAQKNGDVEGEVANWMLLLRKTAAKALEHTVDGLRPSGRNLRAAVVARSVLNRGLNKMCSYEEVTDHARSK